MSKIMESLKIFYRNLHPDCPDCKDGKLRTWGWHDKPDGTMIWKCDRCGEKFI